MTLARVVRGGSWINNQDNARASYRNNNTPDNRNNNLGFRVCCLSHIAPCSSMAREYSRAGYVGLLVNIPSKIARRLRFAG